MEESGWKTTHLVHSSDGGAQSNKQKKRIVSRKAKEEVGSSYTTLQLQVTASWAPWPPRGAERHGEHDKVTLPHHWGLARPLLFPFHVNQIIPRINTKGKLLGIPRKIRLAFFQTNNIVQPNVLLMFQCLRFFFSIYASPSNTVYTVLPEEFGFFGFENLKMRNRMN